jgi:hypothetical protein
MPHLAAHLTSFHGLPVYDFPGPSAPVGALPEADACAWRIATEVYDAEAGWTAVFERFRAEVDSRGVRALIVGAWEEAYEEDGSQEVMKALIAAREEFPALRAVFFGDMESEECEISWIHNGDVSPLLDAFPELEELGVRGGTNLRFTPVGHAALRRLVVETGGLPAEVVRGIGASDFPELEHLELWLGTPDYGGDCDVSDLEAILSGARLPKLRHLGLRNSEIEDRVAAAVAAAPVVARLSSLDLSMGILTDEGAAALLAGQPLTHLERVDLHYHYLSEPFVERLRALFEEAGVEVDLDRGDAQEEEADEDGTVWRYVAVGE